jgi:hypothetical protein
MSTNDLESTLHVLNALATSVKTRADRLTDVEDPQVLSNKLAEFATALRQRTGDYDSYRLLIDSADSIEVLLGEIDELSDSIRELREERTNLVHQLASYRVVETFPATRETPAEHGVRRVPDPDQDRD